MGAASIKIDKSIAGHYWDVKGLKRENRENLESLHHTDYKVSFDFMFGIFLFPGACRLPQGNELELTRLYSASAFLVTLIIFGTEKICI